MKVRSSVKKICEYCRIVREKYSSYVPAIRVTNSDRVSRRAAVTEVTSGENSRCGSTS
jgi:ribosomal protein L36